MRVVVSINTNVKDIPKRVKLIAKHDVKLSYCTSLPDMKGAVSGQIRFHFFS